MVSDLLLRLCEQLFSCFDKCNVLCVVMNNMLFLNN
jgi:hypothetical protein